MAASCALFGNCYTLSDFVEAFELPKNVWVTKGHEERKKLKKGQILRFERVSKVNCLSGVTSIGEHKVWIPVDCQQKVEIPSPRSIDEPVETVRELLARSSAPKLGNFTRVLNEKTLSEKQVLKAGEILKLLSVDDDEELLIAMNNRGCLFCLPLSCSIGFHLLASGEEYLLADLIAKDLLPTYVRFVDPVLPEVRRTFIEEDHEHSLGAVHLERSICEQRAIGARFGDAVNGWTRIFWLPIDIDITVTEVGMLDTELYTMVDDGIQHPNAEIVAYPDLIPALPSHSGDECIALISGRELDSKSISCPKGQLRNKETCNDRGIMPGAPRRKSTDSLPDELAIYEDMKGGSPKTKYGTLSNIPTDLSTLTKEDVGSLLKALNLGEYIESFYHNKVDGCRLVDLNKDTLVSSFGLSAFHALKLSKFVVGWRPRFFDDLH